MKTDKIQDERILLERRKIQSTAYSLVVTILLISILIQQFLMKAPFEQFAAEFFILIGCGIYNVISYYNKGIDIWNPAGIEKKKIFINTIVSGLASVILLFILSGESDTKNLAMHFIAFVVIFSTVRFVMMYFNNKKQRAIDNELNDDDMSE